ncbi:MAG TPA: ATP-dependent Clp protease ATP-binding subunit ClpA [Polyangiaceae bacterium]|nr:ATP-dependent Clp protease ATP-binding subunit ClpA [Polyangiaceae bacterium]
MKVSAEVEQACAFAQGEAVRCCHDVMTVEHLLYGLLQDPATARAAKAAGGDVDKLKRALDRFLDEEVSRVPEPEELDLSASRGFQRVLSRAAINVQNSGKEELKGHNVLIAIFSELDSPAVAALTEAGLTRYDLVNFVSHGVSKDGEDEDALTSGERAADNDEDADAAPPADALAKFAINLNEQAKAGNIEPLVGREKELRRAIQVLCRRRKNNPMFVGDAGVGKTAIVEGLAAKIVAKDIPAPLSKVVIYALDMGALVAGTRFRGDFENRVKAVLKQLESLPHAVLFVDEIHTMVGAGAASGGTLDAANLLKPALANGKLRCIGATTFEEFRSHFEKDRALARRFQKIDVLEPSLSETIQILKGLRARYEEFHGVAYTDAALEAAATLADRHLRDKKMPDKAIDLMDEGGADAKLEAAIDAETVIVDVDRIETVLSRMAQIPSRQVTADAKSALKNLEADLQKAVFGQDRALAELASAIKLSRAGLRPKEKPIGSYLFTGPTGVGKTEAARQLAKTMGIELIRFDMSEYMERHTVSRLIGAPPGYVGYDRGGLLTEAVAKTPHAVLLLDEIEKAHPDVFNVLLQVMDHGTLTDNNGKQGDFRHVVLIMTSNVGAQDMARGMVGFGNRDAQGNDSLALRNTFSPEFRNRLDARIAFDPLSPAVMGRVVDKFVRELGDQLADRDVTIELSESARVYLAEKGYDKSNGARPLARLIQDEIKKPLGDELLFGQLEHGGHVIVRAENGAITFDLRGIDAQGVPHPRLLN